MQILKSFLKQFFETVKWVKKTKKEMISQTIISLLKTRENVVAMTQNKIKIIF